MKIVEIAVKRPVTTWMCILTVIVFGWVSYSRLPMDLMPDISYPTLTIKTEWEGVAPEEIEQLITRQIEENVGIVNNLQTITSYSQPGLSIILLEFGWDTDMDDTVISVREILDRISLPDGTEKSQILRYNPNLEAIMKVAFATTKKNLASEEDKREEQTQIRTVLEEDVKDELLTLKGVASVEVRGSTRKNLRIKLDTLKMSSMQLSVTEIYNALNVDNMSFAAGRIEDVNGEYLVRLLSKFKSLGEIENIVIAYRNKIPIRLKEVAQVAIADEKQEEIVKINGVEAVVVEMYKASGSNTVRVAAEIKNKLLSLNRKFASLFTYTIVNDQSIFIDSAIKEVFSSALWGGLLAIIVLFLFLRELKPTMIIAFAIPLSIIAVFIGMYSLGISLNLMSIGGLALGVGMLVDNSIVVLESIDRVKTERKYISESGTADMVKASIDGTKMVSTAVTASTLTTIAVFLPIVFVEGVAGKMFADQAFTVSFALIASLIVALTVNPMLSAVNAQRKRLVNEDVGVEHAPSRKWIYAPENALGHVGRFFARIYGAVLGFVLSISHISSKHSSSFIGRILDAITQRFGQGMEWLREHYNALLIKALANKRNTIIIAVSLLIVSFVLVTQLGMELVPEVKRQEFTAVIIPEKDMGKQNVTLVLDDIAHELISQEIATTVYSTIGEENTGKQTETDSASMFIRLKTYKGINQSVEKTREILSQYPGIEYKLQFPQIFDISMPLQVEIYGTNVAELREISNLLRDRLAEIPQLKDIKVLLQVGKPEITLTFDRDKLARYGLTVQQISRMLELEIKGDVTQNKYTHAGRDIDVRIIGRGDELQNFQRLDEFFIPIGQERIPLKSIAEIKVQNGPSMISRKGQERVGLITANYSGTSLNTVAEKIQQILDSVQLPEGYRAEIGGQVVEMNKSSKSMQFAILLAIFLVYVVMASQFESFKHPFIILFAIPFALIGVVAALFFTGNTITIISLIGVIVLAGIVVNNGIVLIDYTNHLIRKEHYRVYDAILRAGNTRFRPILMTTLTTVLGLLPMALTGGDGSELRSPLAWTIIGGLLSSTLLTLVFIPVVYSLMEKER